MARPRLGENLAIRFHVVLTDELRTRIENFRYANRIPNMSKASRLLMEAALTAWETRQVELGPIDIEMLADIIPSAFLNAA